MVLVLPGTGQHGTRAGTEVEVRPDYVPGYEFPGYFDPIFRQMKELFGFGL